jgi:hypothetical protein
MCVDHVIHPRSLVSSYPRGADAPPWPPEGFG